MNAVRAYLIREYFPEETRGAFTAIDADGDIIMSCVILELPWKDNQRKVSCIPEGMYTVKRRVTKKFGPHYHILDVPERSGILQHPGNFIRQIEGCQLPGNDFLLIDGDDVVDVRNSRKTLDRMLAVLGTEYLLYIGSFNRPTFPHKVPVYHWSTIPPVPPNVPTP